MRRKLHELGFSSYAAYLAAPHWQQLRRRFYASPRVELMRRHFGRPVCEFCLHGDRELQLHHRTYDRLGAERLSDLVLLCDHCHEKCHRTARRGRQIVAASAALATKRCQCLIVAKETAKDAAFPSSSTVAAQSNASILHPDSR